MNISSLLSRRAFQALCLTVCAAGFALSAQAAPQAAQVMGRVASTQTIPLALTLPLRDPAGLNALLHTLYDPKSPQRGQFLTPAQFAQRFSPTQADYDAVAAFARSKGLTVTTTHSNRLVLDVAGPASAVEAAFSVHLLNYKAANGKWFHAPDGAPAMPASLSGKLAGVVGLDDSARWHTHVIHKVGPLVPPAARVGMPNSAGSDPNDGGVTPSDIAAAYNLQNLSVNGAGQSLAVFELDGYSPQDIAAYEQGYNLPAVPLHNVLVDKVDGSAGEGAIEVTLDIELQIALAPGAKQIRVYEGPNSDAGVLDTYSQIAEDDAAQEISTSWGQPELSNIQSTRDGENRIFQQMAAQGQSIFAAAGDSGAYDDGSTLSVDDPASQPYMVGVGGTTLSTDPNTGAYQSESAWSDGSASPGGSGGGGGISQIWPAPAYQTGLPSASNGRNVPDVSLDADPNTGYSIFFQGGWTVVGGTSCAAPLWAAFTALVNQQRAASGRGPLGFANPPLYQIAEGSHYNSDFHDINDGSDNLYYQATQGYDNATGWGTFIGSNLLTDLANLTITAPLAPPVEARILWTHSPDGLVSLWTVTNGGGFTSRDFGPYAGWSAVALSSAPGGLSHLLWTNANGTASLWTIAPTGAATQATFGPYSGWTAKAVATGTDGMAHLLWGHAPDGQISLWDQTAATGAFTSRQYGPYSGWSPAPAALSVGPDNAEYLLWNHAGGLTFDTSGGAGPIALWTITAPGVYTYQIYGPYPGWSGTSVSTGPDNVSHILWDNASTASLWNVTGGTAGNTLYGPFSGWSANAVATGSDGVSHILWNNANGTVSLWDVDALGNYSSTSYGPYSGWRAVALSAGP